MSTYEQLENELDTLSEEINSIDDKIQEFFQIKSDCKVKLNKITSKQNRKLCALNETDNNYKKNKIECLGKIYTALVKNEMIVQKCDKEMQRLQQVYYKKCAKEQDISKRLDRKDGIKVVTFAN